MSDVNKGMQPGVDNSEMLVEQVLTAFKETTPLCITGGGSKLREGRPVDGKSINTLGHQGIVEYTPSELVITVRAGTPLADVESQLASEGQMLTFEPPYLDKHSEGAATIGGTIACGLSGPRRPYAGAARDAVLGVRMINGRGELLSFGGQVMKNVAGYDVSRLMVGAQGTLGMLLDISIKVLPVPECERTICLEMEMNNAIQLMNQWASKPMPLSAACFIPISQNNNDAVKKQETGKLYIRLSGVESAVSAAVQQIGGDELDNSQQFWSDLRERELQFFNQSDSIWRLSLPPASPSIKVSGSCLIDWGGAQRWLISPAPGEEIMQFATLHDGYAALHHSGGTDLPSMEPGLASLHQRVKDAFDPKRILNPGRLYEGL